MWKVVTRFQSTCDDSEFSLLAQPRQKRLPLDTWNQSGLQENVFGNLFSTIHPENNSRRIQSDDGQRNREAAPEAERMKTGHTSDDILNHGTITMPTFATMPWTTSPKIPVELPQNYMVGQQIQQRSELQFDKFPNPQSFLVWKMRFKNQVTSCSVFPLVAMLWIKEVEMVDSLDEFKPSRSVCGKNLPNFEM